jgi:hypothetical protein
MYQGMLASVQATESEFVQFGLSLIVSSDESSIPLPPLVFTETLASRTILPQRVSDQEELG